MHDEQIDHGLGGDQRDTGREDGQQPEDGTAVGQQQQHDDHAQSGVQQRGVDALEDLEGIGRAGCRTSHVSRQPGIARRRDRLQVGDKAGDGVGVAEVSLDEDLDRLVIPGRDRADHLAGTRQGRERARVRTGLAQVGRGQPGSADVDHHGRVQVLRGEAGLEVQCLGGFRGRRQVCGRVVLLRALQLARQGSGQRDDDDPEQQDGVLGPAPAGQQGEAAQPAGVVGGHGSSTVLARHRPTRQVPAPWRRDRRDATVATAYTMYLDCSSCQVIS